MAPIIGYSNTRVNSIDTTAKNGEFDKWLYSSNFRAVKAASASQGTDNENRKSFANFLKDAEKQDRPSVVLKPANRPAIFDIIE
jgi:hypothetical protein